jgi:hypothetical protein
MMSKTGLFSFAFVIGSLLAIATATFPTHAWADQCIETQTFDNGKLKLCQVCYDKQGRIISTFCI